MRLCLIGASIAVAFAALGFIAGGTAAAASERDGERAWAPDVPVSTIAALVSPVTEHSVVPVSPPPAPPTASAVDRVEAESAEMLAPVVAASVTAVIAEPVAEQVAAPAVEPLTASAVDVPASLDLTQVAVDQAMQSVVPAVGTALGSVDALVPASVSIPLQGAGAIGPSTSFLTLWRPSPLAEVGAAFVISAVASGRHSPSSTSAVVGPGPFPTVVALSDSRQPSSAPFPLPAESPALPAAPPAQPSSRLVGAGGGGNQCPSDFPDALAPPLLNYAPQVRSSLDPVPASPASDLCSRPD
jgi:hypothetical protein